MNNDLKDNRNTCIMLVIPIAIIAKLIEHLFLPDKYFFDSSRMLIMMQDREFKQAWEGSYRVTVDIFNRINTGGTHAIPSEIRRGSYAGAFMKFVEKCAKDEQFNKLCPISDTMKNRYEDSELIVRFFAYLNNYKNFQHVVDDFLNDFVQGKEKEFDKDAYEKEFRNMLNFVEKYFPYGFAKTKNAKSTPRVRFEAISVGVALALRENLDLVPDSMEWLGSEEFKKHTTTHASNSPRRVSGRIEYVRDVLLKGDCNENDA